MEFRILDRSLPTVLLWIVFTLTGRCVGNSVQRCYGDYYSTYILCTSPSTISITQGSYGVSSCASTAATCCPEASDCKVAMTDTDSHLQDLKSNCNGRQRCIGNPRAVRIDARITCGDYSDFVVIEFQCLSDGQTTTAIGSTLLPSSGTTTTSSNGTAPTRVPPSPPTGLSAGAIAGIVIGVFMGILLIIFIIFAILVRRKNPNWPQTHNWKEPFKDYKSYVPDRVHSVVNRITRRAPEPENKYRVSEEVIHVNTSQDFDNGQVTVTKSNESPSLHQNQNSLDMPTGVQIVRTPQDAIESAEVLQVEAGAGLPPVDDEPMYETIDDLTRGSSARSLRRYDSYDSFDSEDIESERGTGRKTDRMTINDAIYYGAIDGDRAINLQVENSLYNDQDRLKGQPRSGVNDPSISKGGKESRDNLKTSNASSNPPASSSNKPNQKPPPVSPKPGQKNSNSTHAHPEPKQKPPPLSDKPKRGGADGVPGKGKPPLDDDGDAGQVYENTDFNPVDDDGEMYYNADDRYSKLNLASVGSTTDLKRQPYESLRMDSSSC